MEMSGRESLFIQFIAHLVVLIIIFLKTSYANNQQSCPPSSCGDLDNITHPFRLKTDPRGCGNVRYELSCENNLPFLYLPTLEYKYYKLFVQALNYDNSTIRVVDPDLRKDDYCSSIPKISLTKYDISLENGFETKIKYNRAHHGCWSLEFSRDYDLTDTAIFLTCEKPMNGSRLHHYVDRAPYCAVNNSVFSESKRLYSYIVVNGNLSFSDLEESCRVDTMTLISRRKGREEMTNRSTYRDIHNELVYGFEISWLPSYEMESDEYRFFGTCFRESCEYNYWRTCYIDQDFNKVRCLIHCGKA
ncbi:hypothetical protein TIFTF001_020850 [Ficus carica]|uniref:Wall-associated receptor kinase galacturonan-binding domain-containing protein n=1 Tax=Ficus carica TaxID=3494 RepID=A0AA88DJP2_FICCA|nr:hypothetical protein TIFTF001_020850 [Ficus carica]